MSPVEGALRHRVEHAEGRHHRAGGQHLDLQVATGHLVDLFGVVERELVKDVLLRPGALPAHRGNPLRLDDCRKAESCRASRGNRSLEDVPA